jgi:hypothetical protein
MLTSALAILQAARPHALGVSGADRRPPKRGYKGRGVVLGDPEAIAILRMAEPRLVWGEGQSRGRVGGQVVCYRMACVALGRAAEASDGSGGGLGAGYMCHGRRVGRHF